MYYRLIVCMLFVLLPSLLPAQEIQEKKLRPIVTSTMLETGRTRLYDSYLSLNYYSGYDIGLSNERMQMARWGKDRVMKQQTVSIHFANTTNEPRNGRMYMGMLGYSFGYLYIYKPSVPGLKLYGGGQVEASAGFIYNLRNSNNPATAKVDANLALSAMAVYTFKIKEYPITVRYQATLPFAGAFFSPAFGETYYEMFELGNHKNLVHFGSFHNQFNMGNLVTADFPLGRGYVRIGYRNTIRTTLQNYLDTQIYTNSFILGVTTELIPFNRRKQRNLKNEVISVFY
ncbi:DUF3316 domain-containing protein [Coprobacter tertius]|uniref:DUF3316 domain-containing protein n=1 Tax=Coprobacter tertius TaxID=2944915 RepID=A0ABT1MK28_9BACT|nr:DUF3316 domain-containing protein [Coprobacter tertius]MCP9612978.1 DUF3316 domain-containing protein [Coprobacter tertius]